MLLFFKNAGQNIAPKMFSLFQTFFLFLANEKIGVEGFFINLPPKFFICLYFIGVCGDEYIKIYLAWPKTCDIQCVKVYFHVT